MKSVFDKAGHLSRRIAHRAIRESVRRLPLVPKEQEVPRGVLSTAEEWCAQHASSGAQYFSLTPERKGSLEAPLTNEPLPKSYLLQLKAKTPPRFVAVIPDGRVCHTGMVLTPDNYVLGNVTYESKIPAFEDGKLPIFGKIKLPPVRKVKGRVGVIASLWGDNYYHWLFDVVPRLHLLQQSGIAIEHFVVPCKKSFQKQTLELLGITPRQRISDKVRLHLQAESLVVPSLPGGQGNPPRWISDFLRETLTAAAKQARPEYAGSPSRIYISRAEASGRRVTNEEQVLEILEPLGFQTTTLEGLSVAEQILLFHNAEAIVAPHGAALSNLVFCRPQTRVLEFFAPGWIYPVYNFIAANGDMRFACLVGEGERPLPENDSQYQDRDILVNLHQLKSMLKKLEL